MRYIFLLSHKTTKEENNQILPRAFLITFSQRTKTCGVELKSMMFLYILGNTFIYTNSISIFFFLYKVTVFVDKIAFFLKKIIWQINHLTIQEK